MRPRLPRRQTKTGARSITQFSAVVNKSVLREAILRELRQELARQSSAAQLARDEAISEESRPENKWDTHSQEAAYLAEGQARLAAEIGGNIEFYSGLALPDFAPDAAIAVGALVQLEARGKFAWYFVGPRAGGLELKIDDATILVVTPLSPLGRQLLGKRAGDPVTGAGRGAPAQRIVSVA